MSITRNAGEFEAAWNSESPDQAPAPTRVLRCRGLFVGDPGRRDHVDPAGGIAVRRRLSPTPRSPQRALPRSRVLFMDGLNGKGTVPFLFKPSS
jgi:hypothetical protein